MKKCVIIILTFLYIIQGTAKDTREIIIRGDSAFPPYEFINDKGEPDGFNIDLTRAIMDELKLPYDLQPVSYTHLDVYKRQTRYCSKRSHFQGVSP